MTKNRVLGMALAAAALGLTPMTQGASITIGRGESAPGLGWSKRGWSGRERSQRIRRDSLEKYKAQRRANRLRRKALNK
jgi:hypothetical protein